MDKIKQPRIPIFLSGQITILPPVSFCTDGAIYQIHTIIGAMRLVGNNADITEKIKQYNDNGEQVIAGGYHSISPECFSLVAHYIDPSSEVMKKLIGSESFLKRL